MTRGRGTASIVASPVLVGAVTVLVAIVAVFLAYNANQGLPFVPTYDVKAELPSGAKLVAGNEVRVGGFRVGLVEEISPKTEVIDGRRRSIAVIDMKLDKEVEPLPADTAVRVRPRSALGLKYVELTPGRSDEDARRGRHDHARERERAARPRGRARHLRRADARATCAPRTDGLRRRASRAAARR